MSLRHPRSCGGGECVPSRKKAISSSASKSKNSSESLSHGRTVFESVRSFLVVVSLGSLLRPLPLNPAFFLYGNKLVHLFHEPLSLKRLQWNMNISAMRNRDIHFSRGSHGNLLDLPQVHIQGNNSLKHPA